MPLWRDWYLNLRGMFVLVFVVGYLAGLCQSSVAHADEYPTPDTVDAAGAYNLDPWLLQGAVNTTGMQPLDYLRSVGVIPPDPVLAPVLVKPVLATGGIAWPFNLIKSCETPGSGWDANTGNGFEGGLQFLNSTWLTNGGAQYAQHAYQASPSAQVAVAQTLARRTGNYSPWPRCRVILGLP